MKYDTTVKRNELILNRLSHLLFTVTGWSIDLISMHFTSEDFTDRDPKSPSERVTESCQPPPSFVSLSLCCERKVLTMYRTLKLYMHYLISFSQLSPCGRYYCPPFHRCKIQVSGRLDDLPKGLQLVNHGTGILIHVFSCLQSPILSPSPGEFCGVLLLVSSFPPLSPFYPLKPF